MTMRATWNGAILAESDRTIVVEGNHYFPPQALDHRYVRGSATHTSCPWKGEASYLDLVVDGAVNPDGAWYYPEPRPRARAIRDHVAFWRGVEVQEVTGSS